MNRPGLIQPARGCESRQGRCDHRLQGRPLDPGAFQDFAKIVDISDGAGASFVSVTQSFNTTSSMGRLTLNVLLSFAQFEREVTGERIRDKFAVSKMKGLWSGGIVPLAMRSSGPQASRGSRPGPYPQKHL